MSGVRAPLPFQRGLREWWERFLRDWDAFWFTPRAPHSLAVMRICCGLMLAYVHAVWLSRLNDFFGPHAWIDGPTNRFLHANDFSWSYLAYFSNLWVLGAHQVVALLLGLLMAIGWRTRITIPLAWLTTLMVCHRQSGSLFGLDQIVMMLTMYLMLCRCGDVISLDAWLKGNRQYSSQGNVANNVATRLIQLHLCVIYTFGGLSKLRGDFWWEGSAMWWSLVNYEYQSLDMVWLGRWPLLIAAITHVTLLWETFYVALIWPRLTRPLVLAMAVFVHGGIGLALGMPTFGFMMIVANLAFVEPQAIFRLPGRVAYFRT